MTDAAMTDAAKTDVGESARQRVRATVLARLTNGMYRLQTNDREITAHAGLDLRKAFTRLLPGDQVLVEISPFDPDKARVCSLLKTSQPSQQESPKPPNQRELS